LGVYDLRKGNKSKEKLYALSDSMEEDLLAISLVKVKIHSTQKILTLSFRMVRKFFVVPKKDAFLSLNGIIMVIVKTEFLVILVLLTQW